MLDNRGLSLLVVAAVLAGPGAPPAAAAEFRVNTIEDVVDAAPGDGQCDTGERLGNPPVPVCSLRAALAEAQATTEDDVVHVPAGHYLLTLPRDATYPDGYLRGGALRLAYRGTLWRSGIQAIELRGAGSSVTVIEQTTEDRVLIVHNGGMTALVAGLTLRGGRALKGTGLQTYGGGILNHGDLTLRDAVVEGNEATGDGGGIFSHYASLRIRNTRISENRAGGSGGGIAVGTFNLGGGTHVLDAERLTLSGNRAASGGGLTFRGWARELNVRSSRVIGNVAEGGNFIGDGGGILLHLIKAPWMAGGWGTITDTTIHGNSAGFSGGGIYHYGLETMLVRRTTVSGNTAAYRGGGLTIRTGMVISNSTISGNAADGGGGGIWLDHGGPEGATSWAQLGWVTVAANTGSASGWGSGILNEGTAQLATVGSIFANDPASGNCEGAAFIWLTSGGSNLETGTNCSLSHATDLPSADPRLGPLAANGGSTLTHALEEGSPAIDAGVSLTCPATDQRGAARPFGAACDIGAVEHGAEAPIRLPLDLSALFGGRFRFVFSSANLQALSAHGIEIASVEPARWSGEVLTLPTAGGYLGRRWMRLSQRGGLVLRRGQKSVTFENWMLQAAGKRGHLWPLAQARQQRRILELHDVGWDSERAWATVILTGAGARQLNRQLGTRAFTAGGALGRIEFERAGSASADKLGRGRVP